MEPSIRFVCPLCRRNFLQRLKDLAPGKECRCPDCGGDPQITEESKIELRRSLEKLFPA